MTLNSNQASVFDRVEQYKAMYHCQMTPDESYPWDYQLTDPQIFPAMRAHLARMNPSEARIALVGQGENREVNQQLVNWELNEILITQLMYKIMYSGFMAGHGYAKTGWFLKPALKVKTDGGNVTMRSIQDRADATFVRFNDLFIPNRNIPELDEQPYIIERISMRYGELLDDQKETARWDDKVLKKIGEGKMFAHQMDYGVDFINEDEGKEDVILRSQYVSLLRMTTKDAEEFIILEKYDKDILNKDTDNRYWHGHYDYLDFVPFPEDDEFFSMGLPHTIADLEIALSSTLNQLLTNGRKAGNSMWLTSETSAKQTPDWMFVERPNGVIRVTGQLADYQRLEFNNNSSRETLQLRQELQSISEKTSGISSLYSSGVASSPQVNKTASGAKIIDNNIDQNLQLIISLFGAQILKKMGEHFLELNQQYITQEQTIEVTGKQDEYQYVKVDPSQISADFKVKASSERLLKATPAVKLASLQNTLGILENQKSVKVDIEPLYEELIKCTPGLEDIDADTIIIDPERKSLQVINDIMKSLTPPKPTWNDDHKAMIAIIQKHLIDMQHPNDQLVLFKQYIDELNRWIQAKNTSLLSMPQHPSESINFKDLPPEGQTQMAQQAGIQISQSQPQPSSNPTSNLPVPMTQDQLGGMQQ